MVESWIQWPLHRAASNSSAVRRSGRTSPDASSPCSTRSRARTTAAAGKWSSGRSFREVEQHKRRSRRERQRRPTTCTTFDAEFETQLAAIVANMKPGWRQLIGGQTLGAHIPETILIPLKAPNESPHDETARRRLVALLDTIACEDHISRSQVIKRALVREVEQHIRRALRTLASQTTTAEQEEIDGFCKVLGLGDDWNYTPR